MCQRKCALLRRRVLLSAGYVVIFFLLVELLIQWGGVLTIFTLTILRMVNVKMVTKNWSRIVRRFWGVKIFNNEFVKNLRARCNSSLFSISEKIYWWYTRMLKEINWWLGYSSLEYSPAGNYMFEVNDATGVVLVSLLLTMDWRRSGVFINNFRHISHIVLVILLLTSSK